MSPGDGRAAGCCCRGSTAPFAATSASALTSTSTSAGPRSSATATGRWLTGARLEVARAHLIQQTLRHRLDPEPLARGLGWSAVMRGEVRSTAAEVALLESLTLRAVEAAWARWITAAEPIEVTANVD